MMWWSIIGIILTCVGTVFTLWTVITRETELVGTWAGIEKREDAEKEKRKVRWGISLIILGSILQVIGVYQS